MADNKNMSNEENEELKKKLEEQLQRLGEVYSQCWESEEFKQAFIANPKAIFREYEINFDDSKEYKIVETPEKTIIHVLPYESIKPAMKQFCDALMKNVEDLGDDDSKQILLEGWKWEVYQCTEDVIFMPIPLCPENLTPEELEMVNGGCLLFAAFFLFAAEAIGVVTSVAAAVELVMLASVVTTVGVFAAIALNTALIATNGAMTGAIAIQFDTSAAVTQDSDWMKKNNSGTGDGGRNRTR